MVIYVVYVMAFYSIEMVGNSELLIHSTAILFLLIPVIGPPCLFLLI